MRALIQTAKTESLHKIRSQSFLVMLLAMAILAMIFFPHDNASYKTIMLGDFRGIYNSAWIGNTLAILNVSFLPLILFYFLRGSIQRDATSLRGELLSATQLSKFDYLLGKALSHFIIAFMVITWMTLIALFMQLWIGEDRQINVLQLLIPQLLHVMPLLIFISMITLVFDTIPVLSASIGNVVYFFLASGGLILLSNQATGIDYVVTDMTQLIFELKAVTVKDITIGISVAPENAALQTFLYEGVTYSEFPFASISYIFLCSVGLFVVAWISFNRGRLVAVDAKKGASSKFTKLASPITKSISYIHSTVQKITRYSIFLDLARQEFKLLSHFKSSYLWLALATLWIAQCFVPQTLMTNAILPAVLMLSALVVSSLGQREKSNGTQGFLLNSPVLMKVQYPAMLFAGFLFLVLLTLPSLIRLAITYEFYACALLFAGYFSIVSTAILIGTLTGSNKMFEIVFVIVWYMGPLSHFVYFDFVGIDSQLSKENHAVVIFTVIGLVLSILTLLVRKQSLRS